MDTNITPEPTVATCGCVDSSTPMVWWSCEGVPVAMSGAGGNVCGGILEQVWGARCWVLGKEFPLVQFVLG